MGRLSETFFTATDKEAITSAIREAETTTAGEIVVMVVDHSDEYREAAVAGGVLTGAFAAVWISVLLHHETLWFYVPVAFVCSLLFGFLFRRFPRLSLPLVPRGRLERAVRERGIRAFYEKGLYRTRDESGILIFLSLLEHKVWILGDRGINARIDPDRWKVFANRVAKGVSEGHAADALCSVIGDCKEILATHFPRRHDDTNELSDHLIT